MNIYWLAKNLVAAWRYRDTTVDAVKRLLLTYQHKLPESLRRGDFTIGYRYPKPIGRIRLLIRANSGSDLFIHSEVFEHCYYALGLRTTPRTILDLGANAGFTAVYFGRLYPNARIACVEPIPDNVRVLKRNLVMNEIQADVVEAAIDTNDGSARMKLHVMDYGHTVSRGTNSHNARGLDVAAISMSTLLDRLQWDHIDLLKMDIEGHERMLLCGECTWLQKVETICIECHDGFETELPDLAQRHGFDVPIRLPGIWLMQKRAAIAGCPTTANASSA